MRFLLLCKVRRIKLIFSASELDVHVTIVRVRVRVRVRVLKDRPDD